jgi:hypothetical protein
MRRRHPHEGRLAEVYRREGDKLVWIGYTADPSAKATWSGDLQGWIIDESSVRGRDASQR